VYSHKFLEDVHEDPCNFEVKTVGSCAAI
jgi:hypothetical protein